MVFISNPLSLLPDLSQSSVHKVLRRAVRLSIYNYVCHHISGENNVWADLLRRWSLLPSVRHLLAIQPLTSSADEELSWPLLEELARAQSTAVATPSRHINVCNGLWQNSSGAIWVPPGEDDSITIVHHHPHICMWSPWPWR